MQHSVKIGQRKGKGHWEDFDTLAYELQPYLQPVDPQHTDNRAAVRRAATHQCAPSAAVDKQLAAAGSDDKTVRLYKAGSVQSSELARQTAALQHQAKASPAPRLPKEKTQQRATSQGGQAARYRVPGVAQQQMAAVHGRPARAGLKQCEQEDGIADQMLASSAHDMPSTPSLTKTWNSGVHADQQDPDGLQWQMHTHNLDSVRCPGRAQLRMPEQGQGDLQLRMVSQQELEGAGRMDLLHAVRTWGGFTAVADRLNVLPNTR